MDCVVIPVIAALAASGVPVSQTDHLNAPRGVVTVAQIDADGEIVAQSSMNCSAVAGCTAPIHVGRNGLTRIRLVLRPDGGAGMHLHPVVEDERGRELDAPSQRACWRATGMARIEIALKPLREPGPTRGLRLARPEFDDRGETVTLAIAITPGL